MAAQRPVRTEAPMTPHGRRLFAVAVFSAVAFFALIAFASRRMGLLEGFGEVLRNPWGVVALVDLYLGFLFVALWMALLERRWWQSTLWIVALFALGNGVTALYLAWRVWRMKSPSRAVLSPDRPTSPAWPGAEGPERPERPFIP